MYILNPDASFSLIINEGIKHKALCPSLTEEYIKAECEERREMAMETERLKKENYQLQKEIAEQKDLINRLIMRGESINDSLEHKCKQRKVEEG